MDHAGYWGFAFLTRLAFFTIGGQLYRIISCGTAGVEEITQGGSSGGNTVFQSGAYARNEVVPLSKSDSSRFSFRINTCLKQGFAGVDIADSRNALSIHDERLNGGPAVFSPTFQSFRVGVRRKWVRSHFVQ